PPQSPPPVAGPARTLYTVTRHPAAAGTTRPQPSKRTPMQTTRLQIVRAIATSLVLTSALAALAHAQRPMTFMDVQEMRRAGSTDVSPDGRWMLYTVSFPDWEDANRQSDAFLVSTRDGLPSTE